MNNTCPKCGTAYNVSAAAVGRKFTCKNCGTPVVVTEAGLDYQNQPAAAPPAKAPAGGGGAFDFDGPAEEEERKPSKAAKSSKPVSKPPKRARDEEPDDRDEGGDGDEDYNAPPKRRAHTRGSAGGGNVLKDFLFFREFIAPIIVKIIFFLAVAGIILGGLGFFVVSLLSGSGGAILGGLVALIIGVPLSLLTARVYCELILLGFSLYDRLGEIKVLLEKQNPPAPPAP